MQEDGRHGQDARAQEAPGSREVACGRCGQGLRIRDDDLQRRCTACGQVALNDRAAAAPPDAEALPDRDEVPCEALIGHMRAVFARDVKRTRHALMVLDWAERILQDEGADAMVVKAAAVLHDIGIGEAERKHGSAAGAYQQIEGPPIARRILQAIGFEVDAIDHVCAIIADHHTATVMDSLEFQVLWDADNLVNLMEEPPADGEKLRQLIDRTFKTATGRRLAARQIGG